MPRHDIAFALMAGTLALSVSGCGADEAPETSRVEPKAVQMAVDRGTGIDPASYAGDIAFKVPVDLPIEDETLSFVLYAGLDAVTETRLGANVFVDLRSIQLRLPDLVSGVLDETCGHEIAINLIETEAKGDLVRARGTVRAKLFSCDPSDPAGEKQGFRWLTQNVDAIATAKADVRGGCIEFSLLDLELDPRGVLGGAANMFGLTDIARSVVLEETEKFLAENLVCPALPGELSALSPNFSAAGVREIGDGGIGVALSGSVDTSAKTIISLLALVDESGMLEEGE